MKRNILVIFGIFIILTITNLGLVRGNSSDELDNNDSLFSAIIAQNGNFKSSGFYLDIGDEIETNVRVIKGGAIDVYIMTEGQYETAYKYNETLISISFLNSKENIKNTTISYKVPDYVDDTYDDYYYDYWETFDNVVVVVDNRNCTLTPHDADSNGPVTVKVDIKIKRKSDVGEFPDIVEGLDTVCISAAIIIVIILIIVIIYFLRNSKQKSIMDQSKNPPQIYYQYPPWPPYPPPNEEIKQKPTKKLKTKD